MKKFFFLALLFLVHTLSFGQRPEGMPQGAGIPKINLKGNVVDNETQQPLEYATISLVNNRFP